MSGNRVMVKISAILFMLTVSLQSFAQIRMEPPPPPKKITSEEEKARQQTRWMNKNLDLELEQYMKVNNINLTYAKKIDSLEKHADKRAKGDYMAKLKASKEADLRQILTPEQYKMYIAHKEKPTTQKKSPFASDY